MRKYIALALMLMSVIGYANSHSNLEVIKEVYRQNNILAMPEKPAPGFMGVLFADRIEADVLLEMAIDGNYKYYGRNYKDYQMRNMVDVEESILMLPRIDILEKGINHIAAKSKIVYVFIMEGDKLLDNEVYGDRSYETYLASGLKDRLPANVKVYRLLNDSVTTTGNKNNYEFSDIVNSKVFINQILPIYNEISKIRAFNNMK